MIILMNGLPGSGKSTMAKMVTEAVGGICLATDEVRKRLFQDISYDNRYKELVYKIIALFIEKMSSNQPVVVDATFSRNCYRRIFDVLGLKLNRKVFHIHCLCDERICLERIRNRAGGYSDADAAVYNIIKGEWEEYDSHVTPFYIDTENEPSENLRKIVAFLDLKQ